MSDDELIDYYHDLVHYSLGSQTEVMYDHGYDMEDIKQCAEYEKYINEECDIVEDQLRRRNLDPWKGIGGVI